MRCSWGEASLLQEEPKQVQGLGFGGTILLKVASSRLLSFGRHRQNLNSNEGQTAEKESCSDLLEVFITLVIMVSRLLHELAGFCTILKQLKTHI